MRALVAAPNRPGQFEIRDVPEPSPRPDQALVEVRATSLNLGEVRWLMGSRDGARLGWDLAGVVAEPAADGSGPYAGARVVGMVGDEVGQFLRLGSTGAWAERVAVPTNTLSEIPDELSFRDASTLPVAGLTAYRTLVLGGSLLGRRVLITGASGGVGRFLIQLARLSGAHVTAVANRTAGLAELGADDVLTTLEPAGQTFDHILESVGGESLAAAVGRLASGGMLVIFGNSSQRPTTISGFMGKEGATIYVFLVFVEVARHASGDRDLNLLARLMAAGSLIPQVDLEVSWREAGSAFQALLERRVSGKAVLNID